MKSKERRRYDMFTRVGQFGTDNAADFPVGSVGAAQFAEVVAVINMLDQLTGNQSIGLNDARYSFAGKNTARENLREDLSDIAMTARSMVYQFPNIDEKFRLPRNKNDQQLLAAARAFLAEATAMKNDFIAYGMPSDFTDDLQADIETFENCFNMTGNAIDTHTEATAAIDGAVRRGMIAVRTLNGVIRNVYRNNPGKLAAWTSASHVERTAKKAPEPAPVV